MCGRWRTRNEGVAVSGEAEIGSADHAGQKLRLQAPFARLENHSKGGKRERCTAFYYCLFGTGKQRFHI